MTQRWRLEPHLGVLAILVVIAFALRVAWVSAVNPDPLPHYPYDAAYYYNAARGLVDGQGYTGLLGEQSNLYPPGYPLLLAGVFSVFGKSLIAGKLANCVIGALTVVLVYLLGSRVADRRVGLVAAGIMAVFPGQVLFTTMLMTEVLFGGLTVLLLLLLTAWAAERRPSGWQLLALGVLVGFMTLVRTETLLLLPSLALLLLLYAPSWREGARQVAVLALGASAMVLPWSVRNEVQLDTFELRSGSESALRIGLSPDFDYRLATTILEAEPPTLGEIARYYRDYPADIGVVAVKKLGYLFGNEEDIVRWLQDHRPAPLSPAAADRWSDVAVWFYYAVAVLAAAGTAAWLAAMDRRRGVVLWFIVTWSCIYLIFAPQGRYHFPLVPLLSVLAAFALVEGWRVARAGSRRFASAPAGGAPVTAVAGRPAPRWWSAVSLLAFAALAVVVGARIVRGFDDPAAQVRDLRRQTDLSGLSRALRDYAEISGAFPNTGGLGRYEPLCTSNGEAGCALTWVLQQVPPGDPLGDPAENGYWYASDGERAAVYALRETGEPWAGPACPPPSALRELGELQCVVVGRDLTP